MICKLFDHKWSVWSFYGLATGWTRRCSRRSCRTTQTGGYGKRVNYRRLKTTKEFPNV